MLPREAALLNRESDGLLHLAFPPNGVTLPRVERVEQAQVRIRTIGSGLVSILDEARPAQFGTLLRAATTYCTAPAIEEYIATDAVQTSTVATVAGELNELGEAVSRSRKDWQLVGSIYGLVAELGVIKTVWGSIQDGYARRGYAFLSGPNQRPRVSANGMLTDVDVVMRLNGLHRRVQVKTTEIGKQKKQRNGKVEKYRDGIPVISAEELSGKRGKKDILKSLLNLHASDANTRAEVYQRLFSALGIGF